MIPVHLREVNLMMSVRGLDHGTFHFAHPVLAQIWAWSLFLCAKSIPKVLSWSNMESCQKKTYYQGQVDWPCRPVQPLQNESSSSNTGIRNFAPQLPDASFPPLLTAEHHHPPRCRCTCLWDCALKQVILQPCPAPTEAADSLWE